MSSFKNDVVFFSIPTMQHQYMINNSLWHYYLKVGEMEEDSLLADQSMDSTYESELKEPTQREHQLV